MCGQYHHVIPRELGTWLFQEYSLEWDDNFDGYTVFMAQCGSHSQYTERIKNIIAENCPVNHDITNPLKDDRHQYHDCIKKFAENLVNIIKKNYSNCHPDHIQEAELGACFPGAVPYVSSKGRTLKSTKEGSWIK